MANFSELIKKFDKIRDYMRDFYVYGFKSRSDFTKKSARTYDNEKRRIESYMGEYMKWDYTGGSKTSFISVDCANIPENPLYSAWKSKSFTSNDIMLHFYILDILQTENLPVDALTDLICEKSSVTFDVQTVRNKCSEYVKHGILSQEKQGKAFVYRLNPYNISFTPELLNAVMFFQGSSPLGEIGSFILDNENRRNDLFAFKHHYIAHTLEDGILLDLLEYMRKNLPVSFESQSVKTGKVSKVYALPLKIFVSTGTGRRYLCGYSPRSHRFSTFRLDYIKSVAIDKESPCTPEFISGMKEKLNNNLDKVWGVSFGSDSRSETISMKLHIDEKHERYIIDRITREGQGGELQKLNKNTFLFTKEIFDSTDMSPWIKTFTGRIIRLEGTNDIVINRFYEDIRRMAEMYEIDMAPKVVDLRERAGTDGIVF